SVAVGDLAEATRLFERAKEIESTCEIPTARAEAAYAQGVYEGSSGRPRHSYESFLRARDHYLSAGQPARAITAEAGGVDVLNRIGRCEEAARELQRIAPRMLALGAGAANVGATLMNVGYAL